MRSGAISVIGLATLAVAQTPPRATFTANGATITGVVKSGAPLPNGGQKITLAGGVTLSQPREGVSARAGGMVVTLGGASGALGLRRADFSGGVTVTRTRGGDTSTLTGSAGAYVVGASGGEITLAGPVTMTNKGAQGRGMTAKGRSGRATLGENPGGGSAVRSALLEGAVDLMVSIANRQTKNGPPPGTYVVRGDRAAFDFRPSGAPGTIRVTGRVSVRANSSTGNMNMPALSSFTVGLNERGEATTVAFQGVGGG